MTHKPGPAQAEEQAELRALRARTAADARQAGDTLAVLTGRMAEVARPPVVARRTAVAARTRAGQAVRQLPQRLVPRPAVAVRSRMAVAVGVPAGIVAVALAVMLWQHRRMG